MGISKALIIVVLSYAMRKLENTAPFLAFLWQALIPGASAGVEGTNPSAFSVVLSVL